jgi:hypothetical protein
MDRASAAAISLTATLQRYCAQYGISESRIRALVGSTCASLDQIIETPAPELAAFRLRASALELELRLNSAATWAQRVRHSSGMEALFDRDLRFLAVSHGGKVLTPLAGDAAEMPESAMIGQAYFNLLPDALSRCGQYLFGVSRADWQKLASGALTGLQLELELNYPFHHMRGVMEFWPILTADHVRLLHSVIHRDGSVRPSGRAHGLYVERAVLV